MTTKLSDLVIGGPIESQFEQDQETTTGLTFGYRAGIYNSGTNYTLIPAGTVTLDNNAISDVYIDTTTTPVVAESIVSLTPATNILLLARVTTSGGAITNVDDLRHRRTGVV